eukprot:Nk52_evm37s78 gene=Nk52_evmTU37s78
MNPGGGSGGGGAGDKKPGSGPSSGSQPPDRGPPYRGGRDDLGQGESGGGSNRYRGGGGWNRGQQQGSYRTGMDYGSRPSMMSGSSSGARYGGSYDRRSNYGPSSQEGSGSGGGWNMGGGAGRDQVERGMDKRVAGGFESGRGYHGDWQQRERYGRFGQEDSRDRFSGRYGGRDYGRDYRSQGYSSVDYHGERDSTARGMDMGNDRGRWSRDVSNDPPPYSVGIKRRFDDLAAERTFSSTELGSDKRPKIDAVSSTGGYNLPSERSADRTSSLPVGPTSSSLSDSMKEIGSRVEKPASSLTSRNTSPVKSSVGASPVKTPIKERGITRTPSDSSVGAHGGRSSFGRAASLPSQREVKEPSAKPVETPSAKAEVTDLVSVPSTPKRSGPTKESILSQIEKLDGEISKFDNQIAKYKGEQKKKEEALEDIEKSKKGLSKESARLKKKKGKKKEKDTPKRELVHIAQLMKEIYQENQEKSETAHSEFEVIMPNELIVDTEDNAQLSEDVNSKVPSVAKLPILYEDPDDALNYKRVELLRRKLTPKVVKIIRKRKLAVYAKVIALSAQYKKIDEQWKKKLKKQEENPKRKLKEKSYNDFFERAFPEMKKEPVAEFPVAEVRQSGRRARGGDVIRSDADLDLICQQLWERERQEKDYFMKTLVDVPSMILDEYERKEIRFVDENGFVEDSASLDKQRKFCNRWTAEEKAIFTKEFVARPKNFRKIASMLPNKTCADCVNYYYLSKKKVNYKKLVKTHMNKTRKKQLDKLVSSDNPPFDFAQSDVRRGASSKPSAEKDKEKIKEEKKKEKAKVKEKAKGKEKKVKEKEKNKDKGKEKGKEKEEKNAKEVDEEKKPVGEDQDSDLADSSRWTDAEIPIAAQAIRTHGRNWAMVASILGTKTESQCKNFFNNYRKKLNLDVISEELVAKPKLSGAPKEKKEKVAKKEKKEKKEKDKKPKKEKGDKKKRSSTGEDKETSVDSKDVQSRIVQKGDEMSKIASETSPEISTKDIDEKGEKKDKRIISYWTAAEKTEFLKYFAKEGKDWKRLSELIPTKTQRQIKNYFQNYKNKLNLASLIDDPGLSPSVDALKGLKKNAEGGTGSTGSSSESIDVGSNVVDSTSGSFTSNTPKSTTSKVSSSDQAGSKASNDDYFRSLVVAPGPSNPKYDSTSLKTEQSYTFHQPYSYPHVPATTSQAPFPRTYPIYHNVSYPAGEQRQAPPSGSYPPGTLSQHRYEGQPVAPYHAGPVQPHPQHYPTPYNSNPYAEYYNSHHYPQGYPPEHSRQYVHPGPGGYEAPTGVGQPDKASLKESQFHPEPAQVGIKNNPPYIHPSAPGAPYAGHVTAQNTTSENPSRHSQLIDTVAKSEPSKGKIGVTEGPGVETVPAIKSEPVEDHPNPVAARVNESAAVAEKGKESSGSSIDVTKESGKAPLQVKSEAPDNSNEDEDNDDEEIILRIDDEPED